MNSFRSTYNTSPLQLLAYRHSHGGNIDTQRGTACIIHSLLRLPPLQSRVEGATLSLNHEYLPFQRYHQPTAIALVIQRTICKKSHCLGDGKNILWWHWIIMHFFFFYPDKNALKHFFIVPLYCSRSLAAQLLTLSAYSPSQNTLTSLKSNLVQSPQGLWWWWWWEMWRGNNIISQNTTSLKVYNQQERQRGKENEWIPSVAPGSKAP